MAEGGAGLIVFGSFIVLLMYKSIFRVSSRVHPQ